MIKQITKTKKILLGILLFSSCILLYTGNVRAIGGPPPCSATGSGATVGSACYDVGVYCQTFTDSSNPPASLATLCNDIPDACSYITTTAIAAACSTQSIAAACVDSTTEPTIGTVACSDISTLCQSPSSATPVVAACSGFSLACSSDETSSFCAGTYGQVDASEADACYDPQDGYTFLCGIGAPALNVQTSTPVVNTNYVAEKLHGNPPTSFNKGECYQAGLIPSGADQNDLGWIEQPQSSCTANEDLNPSGNNTVTYNLPNLNSGSSETAPDPYNCKGQDCIISAYINPFIRFLNVVVSLVAVISIVVGGIQYSSSRDNPESVKKARKHIIDAVIGLVCYFLLYALLNFIIPGGI